MAQIEGFDSKTLNPGSQRPSLAANKLRAYNMRFCPYAQRTLMYLVAKEIPFEIVNVNLKRKPDWLLEINPLGKVPILELNGGIVYESAICNEWLDQAYPDKRIIPADPTAAAHQKMLAERLSALASTFYRFAFGGFDPEKLEKVISALDLTENLLEKPFYGGSQPGWADFMCWPWIERLDAMANITKGAIPKMSKEKYPKLTQYIARMKQQPFVKATTRSDSLHTKFFESFVGGEPNYDLGIADGNL